MERAAVIELHRESHRRMIRRNQLNTKRVAGRAVSGGHSSANSPLAVLIEMVASGVWRDGVVARLSPWHANMLLEALLVLP
jgi:hypothetical protein